MRSERPHDGVPDHRPGRGAGLIFDLRASRIGGVLRKRPWCPRNRVRYNGYLKVLADSAESAENRIAAQDILRCFRMLPLKQQMVLQRVRLEQRSRREAFERYTAEFQEHGIRRDTNVQYHEEEALNAFRNLLEVVMGISPEKSATRRGRRPRVGANIPSLLGLLAYIGLSFN